MSLVVPVFDECRSLESNIDSIVFFCRQHFFSFELICVDDCSVDGSAAILDNLRKKFSELCVLHLVQNSGKGFAVREGFKVARGDLVFFFDADLSTDLSALISAINILESSDVVVGDRHHPLSVVRPQPWSRVFSGWVFSLIPRVFLGLKFKDTQCGFKGFKKNMAYYLADNSSVDRWAFDVEWLYLCKLNNFRVSVVPVVWHDVKGSHVRLKDMFRMFYDVCRLRSLYG